MHASTLTSITGITALATATKIQIAVGQSGLVFTPNTITAAAGDIIEYQFFPPTHSVVMGDFNHPCMPSGGFFSGDFTTTTSNGGQNPNVFQVTINSTDHPIFFYCGVPTHCEAGMAGVINPSGEQTLGAYQGKARGVASTVAPASAPFGGLVVPASGGAMPTPPGGGSGGGGGIYGGAGSGAGGLVVPALGAVVVVVLMI